MSDIEDFSTPSVCVKVLFDNGGGVCVTVGTFGNCPHRIHARRFRSGSAAAFFVVEALNSFLREGDLWEGHDTEAVHPGSDPEGTRSYLVECYGELRELVDNLSGSSWVNEQAFAMTAYVLLQ